MIASEPTTATASADSPRRIAGTMKKRTMRRLRTRPTSEMKTAPPSCHDHEQGEGNPQPDHRRPALVVCERVRRDIRLEAWGDIDMEEPQLVANRGDVVARVAYPQRHLLSLVRATGQLGDDGSAPIRGGVLAGDTPNRDHFGGLEVGRRPGRSSRCDLPARPQDGQAYSGTDRYQGDGAAQEPGDRSRAHGG
jgi:hypothetical protein